MASRKPPQYGLILPSKGAAASTAPKSKNVFGDDSDSDSDDGGDWVKKSLKREAQKSVLKRATKIQMKKALEEDPTVFQYDEVYEGLEQKKEEAKATNKDVEKKPRYIQHLLQTAERRKKEHERRVERQVQKEREEEGEQFADKESFVTTSYRQKLEEFKKQEEEEKRMDRLEAIGDVTKQKDLTGFYRHIYRQTMGETLPGASASIKVENEDGDNKIPQGETEKVVKTEDRKKDRQYRKRHSSSSDSESKHDDDSKGVKEGKDIDADSDFTGPSSSSSESEGSVTTSGSEDGEIRKKKRLSTGEEVDGDNDIQKKKQPKKDDAEKNDGTVLVAKSQVTPSTPNILPQDDNPPQDVDEEIKSEEKKEIDIKSEEDKNEDTDSVKVVKTKIDIWAKRTVGQAFDDAVQRYYERKAARVAVRIGRA